MGLVAVMAKWNLHTQKKYISELVVLGAILSCVTSWKHLLRLQVKQDPGLNGLSVQFNKGLPMFLAEWSLHD